MERKESEFAWKLMVELRKEIVAAQRIRVQMIGFKITFVSAGIGLIAANLDSISCQLFVIPAFAAIFFDSLINSYSFSIKRIGVYCRKYIEPTLKESLIKNGQWSKDDPLWEEFMSRKEVKQYLALSGNLGITILAVLLAVFTLFTPFRLIPSFPVLFFLLMFTIYDILNSLWLRQIDERDFEKKTKNEIE